MRWLRELINPIASEDIIQTRMFVFDDHTETTTYADLLTQIEQSDNLELEQIDENWDQTGVLTKIVTYRIKGKNG